MMRELSFIAMIGGKKRLGLTAETILSKISEYDIFRKYMPTSNWRLNNITNSPFRKDDTPSFIIGNKNGNLYFIDFGDSTKRGGCFDFIKQIFWNILQ